MAAKRPARYRPYRIAILVIFFVMAGVPALLFLRGVVVTLAAGAPEKAAGLDASAPGGLSAACVERAEQLRREISDHFDGLRAMASKDGSAGLRRWRAYSVAFDGRVDAAREACQVDADAATRTAHLFDELEELARVANTVATRVLTDEGDTLARIDRAFAAARK
ncbi:MAG: hypothetical protein P1V51_06275 [Deltaproteobacteria bacterium]|nr:hypothetical protein [Deltaproteobacteria bacterium]